VHWYKATSEKENTPTTLLAEGQIRSEMENLKKIVEVSNRYAHTHMAKWSSCSRACACWWSGFIPLALATACFMGAHSDSCQRGDMQGFL